jgi:hypothetical protein
MTNFDFDKFSQSTLFRSHETYKQSDYPDVVITTEAAPGILSEHIFRGFSSGVESCLCGWEGPSWADHLAEVVNPPVVEVEEPKKAKPAPKPAPKPALKIKPAPVKDAE